jgi:hypothetical protein
MSKYTQADLSKIKTISIASRKSKVAPKDFAAPFDPARQSFAEFARSLPNILAASQLKKLVGDIVRARKARKPVIIMMGAHVIKVGLSPIIIDLLRRNIVTAVAMNSASSIHDVETALWGQTSEDVAENILDGKFGMSKETGEFINNSLSIGYSMTTMGYGETLGRALVEAKAKNKNEHPRYRL